VSGRERERGKRERGRRWGQMFCPIFTGRPLSSKSVLVVALDFLKSAFDFRTYWPISRWGKFTHYNNRTGLRISANPCLSIGCMPFHSFIHTFILFIP